jgi:cell fate (sporulation/competence/biofilm development) regulator YlbF (YheA/YmcA/DUF963 family)
MNRERRAAVNRLLEQLVDIREAIQGLADAERDSLEALPESLQASPRAMKLMESEEALQSAADHVEEITAFLVEAGA